MIIYKKYLHIEFLLKFLFFLSHVLFLSFCKFFIDHTLGEFDLAPTCERVRACLTRPWSPALPRVT